MVTAETKTENVAAAKAAGVSNYIVKPFTGALLRQKIEAVLGPLGRAPSEWGAFTDYSKRRPH
jgi:DNA-binding response OmpR family regulator